MPRGMPLSQVRVLARWTPLPRKCKVDDVYIVDYTGDIPGSLFMALQTISGIIRATNPRAETPPAIVDAGGFANADTYETYLGYVDWLLAQKAKEDAELREQIEKYAAQGTVATVVEDDAAKWAVFAKSSVKGRQSFFGYYAPRGYHYH